MNELWQLGAAELARRIRSKEVSSREVLDAHLQRIDTVNPHLRAIVARLDDDAVAAAAAADEAVTHGHDLGPLHGVPCTVKENIDVAGTPTTRGIPALARAVAHQDAPTVERLRAAGAIPFARTNLPDLGLRVHTRSTLHGLTRNPWRPDVTAGGSSGGEASAIASGMSPLGLGNDIGGSLRNPATCCGIAAIKPSVGVVPMAKSVAPLDYSAAGQQMLCEGPMARSVADLRLALDVIAGPHGRDPLSLPVRLTDLEHGERIRVAVLAEPPGGATHPEIAAVVRRAADLLADAGHEVVEATPPAYDTVEDLWARTMLTGLTVERPLVEMVISDEALALLDAFAAEYPTPTVPSIYHLHVERFALARRWSAFFADHPIVLCPTWSQPAFAHDADAGPGGAAMTRATVRPVLPANLLGLPAVVVPAGFAAGLPVGVQLLGDRFTDLRCLSVAAEIETAVLAAGFAPQTPIDPITE